MQDSEISPQGPGLSPNLRTRGTGCWGASAGIILCVAALADSLASLRHAGQAGPSIDLFSSSAALPKFRETSVLLLLLLQ